MDILRRIQLLELEILDIFVHICETNGLSYFLFYGTLLGAVRHKGFIPWDDDIDIGMSRNDYNKLIQICAKEQPAGYFLQEGRTYSHYWHIYAKFRKNNTRRLETNPPAFYPNNEHRGINIDVFPFDLSSPYNTILRIQSFLLTKIRFLLFEKRGYRSGSSLPRHLLKKTAAALVPFAFLHTASRFLMTFTIGSANTLTCWEDNYKKETFPINSIFPLEKLEFEGRRYNVPHNWALCLKQLYGDYMQLPPDGEREVDFPGVIFDIEKNEQAVFNTRV